MVNKISIIGGNISGLSAAYYLAQKNIPVTIYEAKMWNKPCGGAISLEFDQYLRDELDIHLAESDHYTERFKVGLWNGWYMEDEGVFRITTRKDLQEKLTNRLQELPNIEIKNQRVTTADKNLFTKQTVVATGYSGFTRRTLNKKWDKKDIAVTLRFDGILKDVEIPNTNLIVLDTKKMGYGWVFVGKDNHVNIGVGAQASLEYVRNLYTRFFDMIKDKYNYQITNPDQKPQSWVLPILINKMKYPVSNTINSTQFIGVGDALGLAHSLSGAGIEPAWQSGWILAECVNEEGKIDITKYRELLRKNLRLTVWRRSDHLLSYLSQKPIPFKDKVGYLGLYIIRHRMINLIRKYPWFSLVHNGKKETGFSISNPKKISNYNS
jgi:flavin-dependent dehydrogenase